MRYLLLLSLIACAPKPVTVVETVAAPPPYVPAEPTPLPARPFVVPAIGRATLSNGVQVSLVENHEVPLVSISLSFRAGAMTDPAGKEGLAQSTMDMLNEGFGKLDALQISAELLKLGASLNGSAGDDGAGLSCSSLRSKVEPTLDLWTDALLRPTFPAKDWDRVRGLWVDDIKQGRTSPGRIATVVMNRVLFGSAYAGRTATEKSLASITVKDQKAWHKTYLAPSQALILVGGDITLDELVPMLESRLKGWKTPGAMLPAAPKPPALSATTVHLVDKAAAEQSIVRAAAYVATPRDPDWMSFAAANVSVGGQFASRLNLNLREKQGFTYGARTGVSYDLAGGSWTFNSGIHTEKTAPALVELFKELREVRAERPLSDKEVQDGRGALAGGFPGRFETPDYQLGQVDAIWTYNLPEDWVGTYMDRIGSVTTASAQTAFASRVDPDKLVLVVVGDAAKVRPEIEKLGLPVVLHDVDGNVIVEK